MLRTPSPTRPRSLDDLLDAQLATRIEGLDLSSRKIFAGRLKGERRSKKRGESVEFADHRPYVAGDDLRFIDWNIYGRLDRLFLKLFQEEEDLSLHVVLDASASMDCGEPGKFAYAQRVTASLAYIGLVNLNRVSLTMLAGKESEENAGNEGQQAAQTIARPTQTLRNLRGRRRARDMGDWLCAAAPAGATDFGAAARRIALSRQGKGVMVVLSDFFFKEGYETGLRMLIGRGYDVFCVQLLSPQELEPAIGGDVRLRDIEDGDTAEVTITAPLLAQYKATLGAYTEQFRLFCAARDIAMMTISTATPVETVLLEYFRSRGLLR